MAAYVGRRPVVPILGRTLAWLVFLAVVAAGAYFGYGRYRASKAAAAAPEYFLQPASMGPVVDTAVGSGSFAPAATENVAPQVAGTVSQVDVSVGQAVEANQILFEMSDSAGLAQQLASGQAALDAAEKQLQQLEDPAASADPRTIEDDQLQVQQAQLALNQDNLVLQNAEAAAAEDAEVISPVAGTVASIAVDAGQQVGAGAALATVQPAGDAAVSVSVPQQDLMFLPVGATATVTALGATYTGTVSAIGTSAASSGGSGSASGGSGASTAGGSGDSDGLFPITVSLTQAADALPDGADVGVTFQPQGNPPATYTWSDGGTVSYPAAVTVPAQEAGTVGALPAVGSAVTAGQQIAAVTPASAPASVTQDESQVEQAENSLAQAELNLQEAQSPTPATPAAIQTQESGVANAQEAVENDEQDLTDLTVRTPVAGTVQSIAVQQGSQMQAGTSAVTLQSAGALKAVVDVDELDISQIKVGQTGTVTVGAFPNQQFTATVTGISPTSTTEFGVSYYGVDLDVQGLPPGVRSGMTLNASILIQQVADTLRVPAWSVTSLGTGEGIVQTLSGGRPQPVPVKLGLTTTQWDQVLSGLTAGEQVVAGDTAAASTGAGAGLFAFAAGGGGGPTLSIRAGGAGGGFGGGGGGR